MDSKGNNLAIGTSTGGVAILKFGITPEENLDENFEEKSPAQEQEAKTQE